MNTIDKVSIIIPVYNKELYLKRCFDSLEKQTYSNIEVILVDDGSFDSSLELCKEYQKQTKYECIVFHQDNKGPSIARNKGIELSTGNYILFLDADDSLKENCISLCKQCFDKYNCDFVEFDFENCKVDYNNYDYEIELIQLDEIIRSMLNGKSVKTVVWGAMYSKRIISNIKFPDNIIWGEDSCYKLLVCLKSSKIIHIKLPMYVNYLVPDTLSRMKCNQQMLDSVELLIEFYLENLKDSRYDKEVGKYIFNTAFSYLSLIILQNKKKDCEKGYLCMKIYTHDYYKYADLWHKIAYNIMEFESIYVLFRRIYNKIIGLGTVTKKKESEI